MKLREYQAKQIFSRHGIIVPRGEVVTTPAEAEQIAGKWGTSVVLKPQLGVKGRGKLGGIAFADNPVTASKEAERLFSLEIKGEKVTKLLVEERVDIKDELYVAVTVDYAARNPVMIASSEGGVEVEETANKHPEKVCRIPVHILRGPGDKERESAAAIIGEDAAQYLFKLYEIFRKYDAEMTEINPLIRTHTGELIAVDAVLNVNEDSVFRHVDLLSFKADIPVEDPIAEEASNLNWTYIELPGNIGVLSSGAGLTMAILDLIHQAGGQAANFLDTAQIDESGIYQAFELLSRAKQPSVMLVNIFAGLNRCDSLAFGIKKYLQDHPLNIPVVVRMIGNREEEGYGILQEIGITPFSRLEDAVNKAVELAKRRIV